MRGPNTLTEDDVVLKDDLEDHGAMAADKKGSGNATTTAKR